MLPLPSKSLRKSLYAPRTHWNRFPPTFIIAPEAEVRSSLFYRAAKEQADYAAGFDLVRSFVTDSHIASIRTMLHSRTTLVAAHAVEKRSVNVIPDVLATYLSVMLDLPFASQVVQANVVSHTKAKGWERLARPARFAGPVKKGAAYFLIDDFIAMGGTLANLKGYIEHKGGRVLGACVLTGKEISATMAPDEHYTKELRSKYGQAFENWWESVFGFGFEFLTNAETHFLLRKTQGPIAVRNSILAAMRKGN